MTGWVLTWTLWGCAGPDPEAEAVHETLPRAQQLADHALELWPAQDMTLSWIETVQGFALHRLHEAGGGEAYLDAAEAWLRAHLHTFPRDFASSDNMSPSTVASILIARDRGDDLSVYLDAADAYLGSVPRTDEGAIVHWGVDTPFVDTDEVWIDSQFMFGMYLLSELERTGEPALLDAFVEQYLLFSTLCRDADAQLYLHAYKDSTDQNIPDEDTFWARGNSWVLISGAEALARTEPGSEAHEAIAPLFAAHAEAVLALQAEDGLWHTVMNQPRGPDEANYTETSAAALIGYALARGTASVLDPQQVAPAITAIAEGLEDRILEVDGAPLLTGTSFGTNPGDYDSYVSVPQLNDQLLGYASVVMFLSEIDGMPR